MTGAKAVTGGIAASNLNNLRALTALATERGLGLTVFSYLEKDSDRPKFLPGWVCFRGFEKSKPRLIVSLLSYSSQEVTLVFDHVRLALPMLPLAALGRIKMVIFAHGSESWKRVRWTSRLSFQYATLCIANSNFTFRKMRERIPEFNGVACPLGLSPEFLLNERIPLPANGQIFLEAADGKTRELGKRMLLLVARMDSKEGEKGHRPLIQSLPKLLERFPEVQLVFPGLGDDQENLRVLAKEKRVASSVFLPGWIPFPTLQSLYHHCYAFVMPSRQEGFGLVYLEAMNYGKACVGCFDQGAEEIIVPGGTGYLVHDPDNPEELLGVLTVLLENPERAEALGRKGFERLRQFFTACHYQERVEEAISQVLG